MWLLVCAGIVALTNWILCREFYQRGYAKGIKDKEDLARHAVSAESEKQKWVYEDSINPLWRYSKVTNEVQRRYVSVSPVAQVATSGPVFTEWRSVVSRDKVIEKIVSE